MEETDGGRSDDERYTGGLAIPTEPAVPSRWSGPLLAAAVVILLVALAYAGFRISTLGQYEDPALSEIPTEQAPAGELPGEAPGSGPTDAGTGG